MHLSPREIDKLRLHQAGFLAQKRLARGLRLNYPETVALLATQTLELIRDGRSVAELMRLGTTMLGKAQVLPGVAELIHEVQVEGTFPDGTKLVTIHHPIVREQGDLQLALYGSFLPVPDPATFPYDANEVPLTPGAYQILAGQIELNKDRKSKEIKVVSRGDRPIQVGSHYPFWLVNTALEFDRDASEGMRLNIPAGTAVRFEPGEEKTVQLVELAHELGPRTDSPSAVAARWATS
jgi:urease subunit gamma/beta